MIAAVNEGSLRLVNRWEKPDHPSDDFYNRRWLSYSGVMNTMTSFSQNKKRFEALDASVWKNKNAVTGRVTGKNGSPLTGVKINQQKYGCFSNQKDCTKETLTNKEGFFLLMGLGEGHYALSFEKQGYKKRIHTLTLEKDNESREIAITLQEKTAEEKAAAEKTQHIEEVILLDGEKKIRGGIWAKTRSRFKRKFPLQGVLVTLLRNFCEEHYVKVTETESDERGYFTIDGLAPGDYVVHFQFEGFNEEIRELELKNTDVSIETFMDTTFSSLGPFTFIGRRPVPIVVEEEAKEDVEWDSRQFREHLRKGFPETVFFKILETGETGKGELFFTTPDAPGTYRITAIAYADDAFGRTCNSSIIVARPL
ncbi:MAG: hypothetical protein GY757_59365 [bacterium]|nr:hypothetical protein [bacterium]